MVQEPSPSMGHYANLEIPAHFFVETEGMHGQLPLMDSENTPAQPDNRLKRFLRALWVEL